MDAKVVGSGLWIQIDEANKIAHLAKAYEEGLMWGSLEIECRKLKLEALRLLNSINPSGIFTQLEFDNLMSMLNSKDIESIQLATTLIETKLK